MAATVISAKAQLDRSNHPTLSGHPVLAVVLALVALIFLSRDALETNGIPNDDHAKPSPAEVSDFAYSIGMPWAAMDNSRRFAERRAFILWQSVCGPACAKSAAPLFASLAEIANANAQGQQGGAAPMGQQSCAYGINKDSLGNTDGCQTGPSGKPNGVTLIQHADFFDGYANQSGQTYRTRPKWNVAAVDYAVGVPASVVFKDPAKAKLPNGCAYQSTGSGNGGPIIRCIGANPMFDGFDFSGTLVGSHGCVLINFSPDVTGTITIKNSFFGLQSICHGPFNDGQRLGVFQVSPGQANWDFENNVWDFSPPKTGKGSGFLPASLSEGDWTMRYNVCHNIPGAGCFSGTSGNHSITAQYNFVDTYDFEVVNHGHGEFIAQHGTGTRPHIWYEFNTILEGAAAGSGAVTSNIYISNGNSTGVYNQTRVLNNVTVSNVSAADGKPNAAQSLLLFDGTHGDAAIENNYFDRTGTFGGGGGVIRSNATCIGPLRWSDQIDLVTGASVSKTAGMLVTGWRGC